VAYLLDTTLFLRLANVNDAQRPVARRAIVRLHGAGESLRTAPQNLVEFRNSATRPVAVNGLGLAPSAVQALSVSFETAFTILPETPDIYPAWKSLVQAAGVIGKQVHDARLVAICHVYGITHVLTFNVQHFARFAGYGPGLTVVDSNHV